MNGFVISAVLCVILSFVATGIMELGVWGLIGAQIVSQAMYNLWKWPMLAHREMELRAGEMIKIGTIETGLMVKNLLVGENRKRGRHLLS